MISLDAECIENLAVSAALSAQTVARNHRSYAPGQTGPATCAHGIENPPMPIGFSSARVGMYVPAACVLLD